MEVGKFNTVIGILPPNSKLGDGNTIINATDAHGDTILNQPMVVGFGTQGGPNSTVIGAFAGGGNHLQANLQQFAELLAGQQDEVLSREFEKFKSELQQPVPNKSAVLNAWEGVKALSSINGAHTLLVKISSGLAILFGLSNA